jgi:hypothetical protein
LSASVIAAAPPYPEPDLFAVVSLFILRSQ